jgi:hypothetical protein
VTDPLLEECWQVDAICTCGQVWHKQARRWHHLKDLVHDVHAHRQFPGHAVWLRTCKWQSSIMPFDLAQLERDILGAVNHELQTRLADGLRSRGREAGR